MKFTEEQLEELLIELKENSEDTEPVLRPTVVAGFIGAVTTVVSIFGFKLDTNQAAAVAALAVVVTTAVAGWRARKNAWSPNTVSQVVASVRESEEI